MAVCGRDRRHQPVHRQWLGSGCYRSRRHPYSERDRAQRPCRQHRTHHSRRHHARLSRDHALSGSRIQPADGRPYGVLRTAGHIGGDVRLARDRRRHGRDRGASSGREPADPRLGLSRWRRPAARPAACRHRADRGSGAHTDLAAAGTDDRAAGRSQARGRTAGAGSRQHPRRHRRQAESGHRRARPGAQGDGAQRPDRANRPGLPGRI